MTTLYDTIRELEKIADAVDTAVSHFEHEAEMNAALHMAKTTRIAPLGAAMQTAQQSLHGLIAGMKETLKQETGGNE